MTPSGSSRRLPAAEFNATCYTRDRCEYNGDEYVAEVLFQKVAGHRKNPTYENIIVRSYDSISDIKSALQVRAARIPKPASGRKRCVEGCPPKAPASPLTC